MNRFTLPFLAACAFAALAMLVTAGVAGAKRAPIRDCGDLSMNLSALTAQGTTCAKARAIARGVIAAKPCTKQRFCRVRSYTCLLGIAGKELTLVRCEDSTQTRFVRFEFGA
jgi:hypothetical protein